MEVMQVLARDPEGQQITYHFMHNNEEVQDTPEFHINPYTGVITAWIEFDRERQDMYIVSAACSHSLWLQLYTIT